MPFLARLMLMMWLGFLLYVVVRLQAGEETGLHKFVSWNEFVHDMLAKGEVHVTHDTVIHNFNSLYANCSNIVH